MIYKEYKATEPKVLLNIDNFEYCSGAICNADTTINYIEVTLEEAQYYNEKYKEELFKQQNATEPEEPVEEIVEEQPILLKGIKGLKAAAIEPADPIQRLKNLIKDEMVFKGYNLNNLVEPIIQN